MLFNSYEFIFLFLPISFSVYFYLNKKKFTIASKTWLVFASLFFYGWWNVAYLPLILLSVLFNYMISNSIHAHGKSNNAIFSRRILFYIGLVFNIGLLAYFKYMDFFIDNVNVVFGSDYQLLHLALPLAISFFTLQQIAFLVDTYEGLAKESNFLDYTLFVTFFPQLIAGPIVHHGQMMPQFSNIRNKVKNYRNIALGLFVFSIGLFKKVIIADTLATWASQGFDVASVLNFFEAWITSLSYTFQLYFDFSGYTDMAIGAALLFNIRLPQNFNSPYKATGMIDFWKRWHMTLTGFITTYIYTPIIKSFRKLTFHKAMLATLITFLIAGLWHGASWMFVIFGGLHGMSLVINQYWKKTKLRMNRYLAWFITFNFVNITFIFFRATNWDDAMKVLGSMFSLAHIVLPAVLYDKLHLLAQYGIEFETGSAIPMISGNKWTFITLLTGFALIFLFRNSMEKMREFRTNNINCMVNIIALVVSILYLNSMSEFLYFNF